MLINYVVENALSFLSFFLKKSREKNGRKSAAI